jgi:hypothetical protein
MKWLNGVFLGRYFEMIRKAQVRATLQKWMKTDAAVLGGQLADQHKARRRRASCSLPGVSIGTCAA